MSHHGLQLVVDPGREEAAAWRRHIERPDEFTRIALFDRYRPFALKTAKNEWMRCRDLGLDRGDADQLAYEALLQSIDRFDPRRGAPFTAYARLRIRGAIRNALPKAREVNAIYGAQKRMERDRLKSLKAAAAAAPEPLDPIEALRELVVGVAIGFMLEETAEDALDDVESGDPSAYDSAVWNELLAELGERLEDLPAREKFILQYHYQQDVPFTEIAKLLGLSKGRISQLHAQAVQRLRKQLSKFR